MFDLTGKKALITGACRGLGQQTALRLAQAGATVGIADLPTADFGETVGMVEEHSKKCYAYKVDLTNFPQRREVIDDALKEMNGIDILVNNAGISIPSSGLEIDEELWDRHYNINVKGGFFLTQQIAPQMIERGWGRVIFVASQAGIVAIENQPCYNSSKAAVIMLIKTLGVEWAKFGLTVNGIAPTFIRTDMNAYRLEVKEYKDYVLGMIPGGKLGTTDDVAYAAAYLASEEAKMVNCHTLCVEGGWTAW